MTATDLKTYVANIYGPQILSNAAKGFVYGSLGEMEKLKQTIRKITVDVKITAFHNRDLKNAQYSDVKLEFKHQFKKQLSGFLADEGSKFLDDINISWTQFTNKAVNEKSTRGTLVSAEGKISLKFQMADKETREFTHTCTICENESANEDAV